MHMYDFLSSPVEVVRDEIADLRRRADAIEKVARANNGKLGMYSVQAALRREASALEGLLNLRVKSHRNSTGNLVMTFQVSGARDRRKFDYRRHDAAAESNSVQRKNKD